MVARDTLLSMASFLVVAELLTRRPKFCVSPQHQMRLAKSHTCKFLEVGDLTAIVLHAQGRHFVGKMTI